MYRSDGVVFQSVLDPPWNHGIHQKVWRRLWHTLALCTTACLLHHIVFDPMLVFQATLNHWTIMDNCWMHTSQSFPIASFCPAGLGWSGMTHFGVQAHQEEMKHRNRVYMDHHGPSWTSLYLIDIWCHLGVIFAPINCGLSSFLRQFWV